MANYKKCSSCGAAIRVDGSTVQCATCIHIEAIAEQAKGQAAPVLASIFTDGEFVRLAKAYRDADDNDTEATDALIKCVEQYGATCAEEVRREAEAQIVSLMRERDALQKICTRRADRLEAAGLHADCTHEEAAAQRTAGGVAVPEGWQLVPKSRDVAPKVFDKMILGAMKAFGDKGFSPGRWDGNHGALVRYIVDGAALQQSKFPESFAAEFAAAQPVTEANCEQCAGMGGENAAKYACNPATDAGCTPCEACGGSGKAQPVAEAAAQADEAEALATDPGEGWPTFDEIAPVLRERLGWAPGDAAPTAQPTHFTGCTSQAEAPSPVFTIGTAQPTLPDDERAFEIWSEGFLVTGMEGQWSNPCLHGAQKGKDFIDACKRLAERDPKFQKYFDPARVTHYGCRLYKSRADAERATAALSQPGALPDGAEDAALFKAVGALIKAKGRYHTEQNYKAVVEAYDAARAAAATKAPK